MQDIANILQNILKDTKYFIKEISLEGALYPQVANIRRSKDLLKKPKLQNLQPTRKRTRTRLSLKKTSNYQFEVQSA